MHELSIAIALVEVAEEAAPSPRAARLELEPVEGADLLLSAMEVVDAEVPPNC